MFAWKLGWIGYLVSNFDIIVVTVDGRGTGYRGERLVSNYQEYFKNPSKARFKRRTLHVPNLIIRFGTYIFHWYFRDTFLAGFSVLGVRGRLLRSRDWSFFSIYIIL